MRLYRPTWAVVNLDNLAYNFKIVKKIIGPKVKVMACVKADAYGHGIVPVSKRLNACGVDFLGVASIEEGISIRRAGITSPILILGLVFKKDIPAIAEYALRATVCEEDFAREMNRHFRLKGRTGLVHIKVDTGMGRIGVLHYNAFKLISRISRLKSLKVEGVFTHFPFADLNREFTIHQINLFKELIAKIKKSALNISLFHAANSSSILEYQGSFFDMVRPGLMLYGLYPAKQRKVKLKPVLSLKTRVIYSKILPKGWGVSYGHEYITSRNTGIVTLPIGYGDGYPRNLSNIAPVLIGGRRYKVSGRICMDQLMVDVGEQKLKTGQEAVLIGSSAGMSISVEELAELSGTIPYEIVCGLGSRIPRIFI